MNLRETVGLALAGHKFEAIVCLETAADILGLSNGYLFTDTIRVYSNGDLGLKNIRTMIMANCFEAKKTLEYHGLIVTTPEQTIYDLLEYEDTVDTQVLLEVLSNYYFKHNESFKGIEENLTTRQRVAFTKWRQLAIDYYSED